MKVAYKRGDTKGTDTVKTKVYSDKTTDCQFLLIQVNNKEGNRKTTEEVALAIQTPDDIESLIANLEKLKSKIIKKPKTLKCQDCSIVDKVVIETLCPYDVDINQTETWIQICPHCLQNRKDAI